MNWHAEHPSNEVSSKIDGGRVALTTALRDQSSWKEPDVSDGNAFIPRRVTAAAIRKLGPYVTAYSAAHWAQSQKIALNPGHPFANPTSRLTREATALRIIIDQELSAVAAVPDDLMDEPNARLDEWIEENRTAYWAHPDVWACRVDAKGSHRKCFAVKYREVGGLIAVIAGCDEGARAYSDWIDAKRSTAGEAPVHRVVWSHDLDELDGDLEERRRDLLVEGYTYAISDGEYVKIGHSINPAKRMKQLATGHPRDLELIAVGAGAWMEKIAHDDLREHRGKGEWFRLTPDVQFWIEAHLDAEVMA